jgi:hypothetical protein
MSDPNLFLLTFLDSCQRLKGGRMKKIAILATLIAFVGMASVANALIKDTNIYNIRTHSGGIAVGDSVRITDGVITGIDINPTTYGFWVQDTLGGPYSGILIYLSSLYPTGFRRGQVVSATGQYAEYWNSGYPGTWPYTTCSEVNVLYTWQLDTLGTAAVPAPLLKSCSQLAYDATPYDTAKGSEQWEGMLVKVDTVVVVNGVASYARQYVIKEAHNHAGAGSADTVLVRNDKMDPSAPVRPDDGDTLLSITGNWYYEYGNYRLCPRNGDDIVPLHSPPPHVLRAYATSNTTIDVVFDSRVDKTTAEVIGHYQLSSGTVTITGASLDPVGEQIVTLTTTTQISGKAETVTAHDVRSKAGTLMPDPEIYSFRDGLCTMKMVQTPGLARGDTSQYYGEEVTVAGIVTGDKTIFATQFFMENTPGGQWSGVVIYGGIPAPVAQGDSVIVAGFVTEYYGMTEFTPVHYLRVVSSGNTVPGPDWVLPSQVNTGSPTAENWEAVLVRVDPVFVADTTGWEGFGEWHVYDPRDPAKLLAVGHRGNYTYVPRVGRWMNMRGPLEYVFDNFRIAPRTDDDIDTVNVVGVEPGTLPKPLVFALEQNSPNPFNPVTNIFFSIPEKTEVKLYVCDVSGRVVKRLVDGARMEPGRHKASWDGRNDAGRSVSSGVYFCKLLAADKVAQMKMVVLK